MALQHLRSSTADKRPTPAAMSDGQLAVNTAATSTGLFFKDASGNLVKVGPVHVGTTAPNATPASGGETGNTVGEQWLDTSSSRYVFKIWDGTAWRSEADEFVNASGDTMTGALVMDNQQQVRFRETTANGTNFIALQAPASVTADQTITLPAETGTMLVSGNASIVNADVSATAAIAYSKLAALSSANILVGNGSNVATSTAVTGDVTINNTGVTAIASGVIVDADVNASAAIAGTKISPDFGSQNVATTGNVTINAQGDLRFGDSDSSNWVAFQAPATVASDVTWTLPAADGTTGQVLSTNGSGTLSWATGGGGGAGDKIEEGNSSAEVIDTGSDGRFVITTEGTERARVDSSGRLLVGTSSARNNIFNASYSALFQVETDTTVTSQALLTSVTAGFQGARLTLAHQRSGGVGGNTILQSGDETGFLSFQGSDGTEFVESAAIKGEIDGTPGANDMPGRIVLATTADGASSPTERMRITNGGLVGIGTNSPQAQLHVQRQDGGGGTYDEVLRVSKGAVSNPGDGAFISFPNGNIINAAVGGVQEDFATGYLRFDTNNNGAAAVERMRINAAGELLIGYTSDNGNFKLQVNSQIFATSSTVATSDGRYKENVASLGGCLDLIKALRPVSFTWKPQEDITRTDDDGNQVLVREGHNFPEGTQVGFIAQEVQEVLADKPWLTSIIKQNVRPAVTDAEGDELAPEEEFLGIAEGNLIAVLTSALQEAIGEIESLKARVDALEAN